MSRYRYLNGIDWVIHGFHQSMCQTAGTGNWAQIVLELDGHFNVTQFRRAARRYASRYPEFQGRAVRAWNLVPMWKYPKTGRMAEFDITHIQLKDESFPAVLQQLRNHVAAAPGGPGRYIAFIILELPGRTYLGFRFDHRLFDAHGAETFLAGMMHCLDRPSSNEEADISPEIPTSCGLSPWKEKFISGRHVVRMFHRFRGAEEHFQWPAVDTFHSEYSFELLHFDSRESEALIEKAYQEAGYLMMTPWLASKMVAAVKKMNLPAHHPKGFVIPCSIDMRQAGRKEKDPLFFNHVSFVCLAHNKTSPQNETCARQFSAQFYEQIQQGIPGHFENSWKLARIVPKNLYGRLLRKELQVFSGTFSMGNVGGGLSDLKYCMGNPVRNIFHMPLIPPMPGLGLFANTYRDRFNICMVAVSHVFTGEELERLSHILRKKLFCDIDCE